MLRPAIFWVAVGVLAIASSSGCALKIYSPNREFSLGSESCPANSGSGDSRNGGAAGESTTTCEDLVKPLHSLLHCGCKTLAAVEPPPPLMIPQTPLLPVPTRPVFGPAGVEDSHPPPPMLMPKAVPYYDTPAPGIEVRTARPRRNLLVERSDHAPDWVARHKASAEPSPTLKPADSELAASQRTDNRAGKHLTVDRPVVEPTSWTLNSAPPLPPVSDSHWKPRQ